MGQNSTDITAKQEGAIQCLLTEKTYKDAAKKAGIGRQTLYNWFEDPAFMEAYNAARRQAMQEVIGGIQRISKSTIAELEKIIVDDDDKALKVKAGKIILDIAIKTDETEAMKDELRLLREKLSAASAA